MGGREVTRGRREKGEQTGPARGSRPETETNGLAGSRARTVPAAGPPPPKFPVQGSRPKTETNGLAGSRARTVPAAGPPPPNFPARGSRPETENKGLAGSQARTGPPVGPTFSKLPTRGSRLKTEIKGFARSQARTMPGPPAGQPASMDRPLILFPFRRRRPPALRPSLQQINCIVPQFIQCNFCK